MSRPFTRRRFVNTVAAASVLPAPTRTVDQPAEAREWPALCPATICRIYVGRSGATTTPRTGSTVQYLTWGKEEVVRMDNDLGEVEQRLGDVSLIGGETFPAWRRGKDRAMRSGSP